MGTLLVEADDEFPVSSYVDPAALERRPFYVGYVCLCFLHEEFTDKIDWRHAEEHREETSWRHGVARTLRKKRRKRNPPGRRKTSSEAGASSRINYHRRARALFARGAFSVLNIAIRLSSRLHYVCGFFFLLRSREKQRQTRIYMHVALNVTLNKGGLRKNKNTSLTPREASIRILHLPL